MAPIRVLHENVILDPGGIEAMIMNIYRNIDREKVQFDFLLHRDTKGFYDDEVKELGGRIYIAPPFNPFHHRRYLKGTDKIIKEHPEYKVIHAHSELNLWPLKIAKKHGVSTRISHSHNAKTTVNLKYFFFLYEKLFIKKNCTDMFMCSTPAGEWTYGKKAVRDGKCVFIKNGIVVDDYKYNPKIREKVRKDLNLGDSFVVGHVGRYMHQKNHTFLIDIFNEILKIRPNSKLVSVGDGRLIDETIQKAQDLGITDKILFLGNRNDVKELLQGFDCFLFPSLWEGLPVTGVEAQSAGLPVIMSDVITDEVIVTDLVKTMPLKATAREWAKAVIEKVDSTERKDVSQQVKESGFDIKTTAKWLENFYLERYGIKDE